MRKSKLFIFLIGYISGIATVIALIVFGIYYMGESVSGLTKCEDVKKWEVDNYKIVQQKCIGPAGPHYQELKLKKGISTIASGRFTDSCNMSFKIDDSYYIVFDTCAIKLKEYRDTPRKKTKN